MNFTAAPWIWLYVGAFLMLAEILAPGFVIFFFGLAAATVGLLLFAFDFSATVQAALFSVLSIAYLVGLRRVVKSVFMGETAASPVAMGECVGRVGKVVEAIRPEVPGRILLGDAEWSASAPERLEPGTEVRVVAQHNLTLEVVKL